MIGKIELGIEADVSVEVLLQDGTEIDDNETFLACEASTVFIFVAKGEKWTPVPSASLFKEVTNKTDDAIQSSVVYISKGKLMKCIFMTHMHVLIG